MVAAVTTWIGEVTRSATGRAVPRTITLPLVALKYGKRFVTERLLTMKNFTSLLPHGQYQCRVIGRKALTRQSPDGREWPAVELQVMVSTGPHAGHLLTFLVWGEGKIQRARYLKQDDLLVVTVAQQQLDSGATVNRVVGFRADGDPSIVEALGDGEETGHHDCDLASSVAQTAQIDSLLLHRLQKAIREGAIDPPMLEAVPASVQPAIAAEFATGFQRLGSKNGPRTIVDYESVLQLHSSFDPVLPSGVSGFISGYQYDHTIAEFANAHGGWLKGYRGRSWARWMAMDLDGDGTDDDLQRVIDEAVGIVGTLVPLGVHSDSILPFFSGGRGIHLMWPSGVFAAMPKDGFEATAGIVCHTIAGLAGATIDPNLYKPLASLRAPNTRHEGTGLYKVLLPLDRLATLSAVAVKEWAREPRPFHMNEWAASPVPLLHDLWRFACQVEAQARRQTAAVLQGDRRIFADTFDLMVHGAPEKSRGSRIFKAAMNLLDLDCPEPLLHALLEPAARLSGYPMSDFESQINGAITAHAAKPAANVS